MDALQQAREVLRIEGQAVLGLMDRLDHNFEKAVRLMLGCRGRVVVTGVGKSGIIGRKIASTLASTGTPALFLHPSEGVHGDLGVLLKSDVVLAVSHSGETDEISTILPIIKRIGAKLIALTGKKQSALGRHADIILDCAVPMEACPLGLAPTASTTAALALGDALAVVLLEARGFSKEDFARFHPRGALGKQVLKIKAIMNKGAAIPKVSLSATLRQAIREMSAKRMGCTAVVDGAGKLRGIFTDHDLRNLMEKTPGIHISRLKIKELMNPRPRTIGEDELVAKAIHVTETSSVGTLLVVDTASRLKGIVHLHDLLRTR